jgi:hypothetical protein
MVSHAHTEGERRNGEEIAQRAAGRGVNLALSERHLFFTINNRLGGSRNGEATLIGMTEKRGGYRGQK